MFVKNLLDKALHKQHELISAHDASKKKSTEIDVQIAVHYGTPYTASTMAFDPIQRLLAIGTLDGRIKIIGGDNIEGLLISPKKVPYKHLEFLQNRGFLVAITNENEVQVWNLEFRQLFCSSQWETNITAFAVVPGTSFIFLGDENGLFSVLKYDLEDGKIITMPYHIPLDSLAEKTGIPSLDPQSIVGILPQPNTFGTRVLIAYQKSLLVLWDITENNAIAIRGNGDLRLKQNNFPASELAEAPEEEENQEEEKEICSLCWASSTGSIAAVGYTTGDIYLWNLSPTKNFSHKGKETENMSNTALKLQLASGDRRLPVIVLHWSPSLRGEGDRGGNLFIYGGDEMGSEEVLTVLTIEFPTGLESLRLITRVDLHLNGSFADMILIPDSVAPERTPSSALFVLTNPGQLTIYDCTHFSTKKSEDGESCALDEKFPVLVPTVDPNITVTKLCSISTKVLKKFHATKVGRPPLSGGTKWPLTGGVPSEMSLSKERLIERMYIAGYKDGSVRIWDSTFPILELMFVLNGKLAGMGVGGENVSVSALGFCSVTITLAVGDECGLVRVYKLHENVDNEGHMSYHTKAIQCDAAAMVSNSPIRTLNFTKMGQFLSVGFENGQVAMLEVSNLSAIFCTDFSPETSSSVVSLLECATPGALSPVEGPKLPKELLISLTKDARLSVLDALTGDLVSALVLCEKSEVTAISVYALDVNGKEAKGTSSGSHKSHETEIQASTVQNSNSDELSSSDDLAVDQLLLICCGNMLLLHSLSQILKGLDEHLKRIELPEHCCWSALYRNIEKKSFDLLLVYQNGSMEIRSVPDLELVGQNSLMSILRWSFKTNMDKTMSSSDGQISLLNGSELAIISLLTSQNSFRILESAPCLHDKVLAAAVEAAISASVNQKRKQEQVPGILGGIVKGLKGGRGDNSPKFTDEHQLEALLSTLPFSESLDALDEEEEINIDDIIIDDVEIDEPMGCGPSSMQKFEKQKKSDNEREKLFEGSSDVPKPRMRTQQEILTKYKYGGDASAAAAHAKEKLMQRQEKLDRISQRTAELQDGAENFANLANELVKNMEKKKWWNI